MSAIDRVAANQAWPLREFPLYMGAPRNRATQQKQIIRIWPNLVGAHHIEHPFLLQLFPPSSQRKLEHFGDQNATTVELGY